MAGDDEDNNNKYKHRGYEILSFMYIIMKGETVIIKWDILEPIFDGLLDQSNFLDFSTNGSKVAANFRKV